MNDPQRLDDLFSRYYRNRLTEKEQLELAILVKGLSDDEIAGLMRNQWEKEGASTPFFGPEASHRMLSNILGRRSIPVRKMTWARFAAAAAVLFLVALVGFWALSRHTGAPRIAKVTKTDILPGHNGAILTLANGHTIVLDSARDGKITDAAVKNGNSLSYKGSAGTEIEYNTMTTPKGRQFSLVLPDGTQVWLNAASSITYPTAFAGDQRKVSVTGEVYLEVARDAARPFHVSVNGMDVQVLGTHFDLNAYGDEGDIKTTLLQGSIQVAVAGKTQLVKPGEQTQVKGASIRLVADADLDAVMAWKNGFFSFDGADIKEILKQLSRWYDVEVIYQAEPSGLFAGKIDRNLTLSQVLKVLSDTKVNYRIEGRKLVILP